MRNISTTDINHILYENAVTRRYFVGTFPACMAPKTRRKFYTFITNSEEHDKAGEHWNAWRVKNQDCESFLSDYTPDYVKNDVIVKNIVKSF